MAVYKVFHGTREGTEYSGATSAGLGEWFGTDNLEYAKRYGKVHVYEIVLANPYHMNVSEFRSYDRGIEANFKRSQRYREELERKGYDRIIVTHHDGVKEYILFNKKMIRKLWFT